MTSPCTQCGSPRGYEVLGHKCVRCYRGHELFALRETRDKAELEYNYWDSMCYRIEVYEGLRPPPAKISDRPTHDVQGDPAMGQIGAQKGVFSSPMKQVRRSTINAQDMTDEE